MKFLGLVKFEKTGNIYLSSYDTVIDVMCPFLISEKDMLEKYGAYSPRDFEEDVTQNEVRKKVKSTDNIEIYTSYANGFYWKGKGNEEELLITENICCGASKAGKPYWVVNWYKERNLRLYA